MSSAENRFPPGWTEVPLGEVASLRTERIDPADAPDAPYIGLAHVEPETMRLLGRGQARDVRSSASRFYEGDVLYGRLRPYLNKVVLPSFSGLCSAEFAVLKPGKAITPGFLARRLTAADVVSFAMSFNVGVHRPRVRWEQLREFTLGLPPFEEQESIISSIDDFLFRVEDAMTEICRAKERMCLHREVIYSQAVQGPWKLVELGALLREPLRNGHSAKASGNGVGIRTLTLTAVTSGSFTDSNTKLTTADGARVRDLWLEEGDILVERSNTPDLVGTAALYRGKANWAIFPDLLIRVRVGESVLPEYLEIVLKERGTRRYFRRSAQGIAGSMPKISQKTIEDLPVPLPSMEKQRRIIEEAQRHAAGVRQAENELEKAAKLCSQARQAVLRRAFNGQLRAG